MTEYDYVIQHLQTQRNDAHNMCINVMVAKSLLEEKIAELELELHNLKQITSNVTKLKGKDNGDV